MIFGGMLLKSRMKKALDLLNCGMYSKAEAEFKEILGTLEEQDKDESERAPILFYLAECYIAMGDEKLEDQNDQAALNDFEKAVELGVKFPDLYFRIGQVHLNLGESDRAEDSLLKAINLNPRYVNAHLLLADVQAQQGKLDLAVKEYEILHEQAVLCDEMLFEKGRRFVDDGDIQKGYEILRESFQERSDPVKALYTKGMRCYQNKDYSGAIQEFKKVLTDHPDYPDVYNLIGVACCGEQSYGEAESAFQKAITLNADYVEPRLNLAFLYEKMGQKEKAVGVFQDILEVDPRNVIALEVMEGWNQEGRQSLPDDA